MRDDLARIDVHRGVEDLLFHTLRLKRLCAYAVDTREIPARAPWSGAVDPANSGRPGFDRVGGGTRINSVGIVDAYPAWGSAHVGAKFGGDPVREVGTTLLWLPAA